MKKAMEKLGIMTISVVVFMAASVAVNWICDNVYCKTSLLDSLYDTEIYYILIGTISTWLATKTRMLIKKRMNKENKEILL